MHPCGIVPAKLEATVSGVTGRLLQAQVRFLSSFGHAIRHTFVTSPVKAVANAAYTDEQFGIVEILLNLAAQVVDMRVNHAIGQEDIFTPDLPK